MNGRLLLGTSSWTAEGWGKSFYPPGTRPSGYLVAYAQKFNTVECDATFYRSPSARTVEGWRRKLPDGFVFSAKVPQVITHEKVLQDCGEDLRTFLGVMDLLEDKLGPLLFQFPYFNRKRFPSPKPFFDRLRKFLGKLPPELSLCCRGAEQGLGGRRASEHPTGSRGGLHTHRSPLDEQNRRAGE